MPTIERFEMVRILSISPLGCQATGLLLALQVGVANADSYRIDPRETTASFQVWMLGFIPIRGQFRQTTGMMEFDTASQAGNIEVLIDTSSVTAHSA